MMAFHKARHRNDLIEVQDWVDRGKGTRTRTVWQQTPLVGPAWLRKLVGHNATMQSKDLQSAVWDACMSVGVFSLDAFVSLDGTRMLPLARVEWRIAPLAGCSACGTQVEAHVKCWAERFAYVGLQGAVEAALLSWRCPARPRLTRTARLCLRSKAWVALR
ncbi:hypothetical protein WJX81_000315 [Elliptochloris bilobata]|uniref:Uncharacterized protein n=1 Tax=Elliptochloris bilobata TaxID=381761 RepID=A0AAW1S3P4_9CHLO